MISQTSPQIQSHNYRFLQQHVYSQAGIVLEADKHYLFECRLAPIVKQLGLGSIDDLCTLLQTTRQPSIARQVTEAMTTNETYFFREPAQYEALKSVLLPELRQQRETTRKLSFWSAASSSGQEAYSLAMLLLEQKFGDWNIQIKGTDLSTQMLEKARTARYLQLEVSRGLPAPLLVKYFQRQGLDWQLKDTVRKMAHFDQLDLRQPMRALGPFDVVFCRNVLIYFDATTRRKILEEIHGTLFRGGWLLLGSAEVPGALGDLFERRVVGNATVYVAR